jgi:hypothetical protein
MSSPAGWYPDADVLRWWDGRAWTGHTTPLAPPAARPERPRVADGTPVHTGWMWGIVGVAAFGLIQTIVVFAMLGDYFRTFFDEFFRRALEDPTSIGPTAPSMQMFGLLTSPWYLILIVVGWAIMIASVFFAYRDHSALVSRGFVKPFHWLWSLLGAVYVVGRSVVVWRQSRRGLSVLWTYGAIYLASIVFSVGWSVWFVTWMTNEMLRSFATMM